MYFAAVLPRHSVTTALLVRLLGGLLAGAALKAAAEALRTFFAVETFYRLRQRLRRRLDVLRVLLHGEQAAPVSAQSDALLQTVEHLQRLFRQEPDALAAFQLRFQRAVLG